MSWLCIRKGGRRRRERLFYCPLNICFLWEKQPQWFQPSVLQGSLQTKHSSGSFRKNILKAFSLQGNTLNRQLILGRLFFPWPWDTYFLLLFCWTLGCIPWSTANFFSASQSQDSRTRLTLQSVGVTVCCSLFALWDSFIVRAITC